MKKGLPKRCQEILPGAVVILKYLYPWGGILRVLRPGVDWQGGRRVLDRVHLGADERLRVDGRRADRRFAWGTWICESSIVKPSQLRGRLNLTVVTWDLTLLKCKCSFPLLTYMRD